MSKYFQITFQFKMSIFVVFDGITLSLVYGVTSVERGHLAD